MAEAKAETARRRAIEEAEYAAKLAEIKAEQEAEREKRRLEYALAEKQRAESDAAEAANRAQERAEADRIAQEQADRDAALRAESSRLAQEKRDIEREKQELLATDGLIGALLLRIERHPDPKYDAIKAACDAYMHPGRPVAKVAKRQGGVSA